MYKAAFGGRGTGKSENIAQALLIQARQRPQTILCGREIQASIRDSVKRLLDDKIGQMQLGSFYNSTDSEIRGANGTLFIFAGLRSNINSIKSTYKLDKAWVEEAHTVSQASLDVLDPTIRNNGGELWFSWNPNLPTDPVDKMFRGGEPPPDAIVRQIHIQDNPWFPERLRKLMEWDKRRDIDKYKHIWLGEYQEKSEARVFKNWRVGEESEFHPENANAFYFGGDWGFSVDPSTLVRCWIEGRTIFIDWEAYAIGCDIDHTPFLFGGFKDEELKTLNPEAWKKLSQGMLPDWRGIPGARKWTIRADSARPETISYMRNHGFPMIVPATKGAGSVEEGVEFLKSYEIVVHPRCKYTIGELMYYSYEVDRLTGNVLPKLKDAKNHVIDAIRYSLEEVRKRVIFAAF